MELDKLKVEKALELKILESIDYSNGNKPELLWSYKLTTNGKLFTRTDGLIISVGYTSARLKEPIEYQFDDSKIEKNLYTEFMYFAQYLDRVEAKRKEQEKLQKIVDFFGLDIKKQRQDKLKQIAENEQDGII